MDEYLKAVFAAAPAATPMQQCDSSFPSVEEVEAELRAAGLIVPVPDHVVRALERVVGNDDQVEKARGSFPAPAALRV